MNDFKDMCSWDVESSLSYMKEVIARPFIRSARASTPKVSRGKAAASKKRAQAKAARKITRRNKK